MDSESIRCVLRDHVATITINRPSVRNALDSSSQLALKGALERIEADPEVRVGILTGSGPDAFCAGADLHELASGVEADPEIFPVPNRNVAISKPLIAAVNGIAYGGGFMLAQHCDLCVAATTARFAIPEARWGRGAAFAAQLPRMIPARVAMELLLTAQPMDAHRAREVGLVNQVVEPDELVEAAHTMATAIAANAPLSVRAGKSLVHLSVGGDLDALEAEADAIYEPVYQSPDALEGPRAFREGRPPRWQDS